VLTLPALRQVDSDVAAAVAGDAGGDADELAAFAAIRNPLVDVVPPGQTGVAAGINTIVRTVGGAVGARVAAAIVASSATASGVPGASGYTRAFASFAVIAVCALAVAAAIPSGRCARVASARRVTQPLSVHTGPITSAAAVTSDGIMPLWHWEPLSAGASSARSSPAARRPASCTPTTPFSRSTIPPPASGPASPARPDMELPAEPGSVPVPAGSAAPAEPAVAGRGPAELPVLAVWPVAGVALALAALLIAFSGRYGYHRDELYFIACGQHLAWGYPDQPPFVPLLARLMTGLAPNSLVVLRLPSAAAAAALVVVTALLTRELGGRSVAQILACGVVALAPLVTGASHLLSTTTFDLPAWALLAWLLVRILRTGDQRLWLPAGLIAGIGLLDTDLVAFLILAVVVALLIAGPRATLRSPWFYAGGVLALALWSPYLAWQASHGWPELTVAHSIAAGGSGTSAPWWLILPEQFVLVSWYFSPVWIAGLWRFFRDPKLRWCRAAGVVYPVLAVAFMATGGKPYYLAAYLPVLVAAGAQPTVDWIARARTRRRVLIGAAFVISVLELPITLPVLPVSVVHDTPIVALNYDAGETIGWPAFVHEIATVDRSLPAAQRSAAIVLASNYGEAGAAQHFGPADGLPAVYSGHNSYWYWGPPPASATTAIVVGYDRSQLSFCGSLRLGTRLTNHVGVSDDEQGAPVWVCSELQTSWRALWPSQRFFG
jgi:4-amino-4-deoxy-L-arabinose transferase-like glycosyltransferase